MSAPAISARSARSVCRWWSTNSRVARSRRCSSAASSSRSLRSRRRSSRREHDGLSPPPRPRLREERPMEQVLVNGLVLSANYALIALGITLIFSIMNLLNFAHGQMFMIGGFMVYYVYGVWGMPYALGLLTAAVVAGLIGVIFEVVFFRRVVRIATREENSMLLAVGTALLLENLALFAFGEKQRGVPPVVSGVYRI